MAAERPRRRAALRPVLRLPTLRRLTPVLAAVMATALVLGGVMALRQSRATPTAGGPTAGPTASALQRPTDYPTPAVSRRPGSVPELRTGLYGPPRTVPLRTGEAADDSEWLALDSPQMPAYLDGIQRELSLPPGTRWEPIRQRLTPRGGRMQETFVRINVVRYALCAWGEDWNTAYQKGDTKTASRLQKIIKRIAPRVFARPDPRADLDRTVILYGLMVKPYESYEIGRFITMNCGESWFLSGAIR